MPNLHTGIRYRPTKYYTIGAAKNDLPGGARTAGPPLSGLITLNQVSTPEVCHMGRVALNKTYMHKAYI